MASRIQALSRSVVNKIAAGEVIERPASVVKELLENSVDALSTRIEIDISAGGTELIRISDDGEGIEPEDLPLAVATHATSKITSAEDLFEVRTMGFRGEALASVAEVSRLRIRSRPPHCETGAELSVELGEHSEPRPCGCPPGTVIEVRQLFENTPVRRKFLKSVSTEFGHISEVFTRVALANPRLHMVLRHNGRTVQQLPAVERLIDRLSVFFGTELTDQLIPVESNTGSARIWGYVGHPSQSKSTRKFQYLFLNGRWIQDRTLQHALTEAYRGLQMVGRMPICFLFLEVPADQVDVNVHPTKIEVRFRDGQSLFRQLLAMIRSKFLSLDLQTPLRLPTAAPHGGDGSAYAPAAHASTFSPTLDFSRPALNPQASPQPTAQQSQLTDEFANWARQELDRWTPDRPAYYANVADRGLGDEESHPADSAEAARPWEVAGHQLSATTDEERGSPTSADTAMWPPLENLLTSLAPQHSQDSLAPTPQAFPVPHHTSAAASELLPQQTRAMQVHDCYLVVETSDGLTVIDQHALHERILYESFRQRVLGRSVESQRLLVPLPIELSAKDASVLCDAADVLDQLGYGVEEFGPGTVLLTRYPVMLGRADPANILRDLAERLLQEGKAPSRRDILDSLLHTMACKAAVKAGQRLTSEEIDSLLAQRTNVDDAHHCPHGRPTALTLSRMELDRQFGRLG